MARGESVPVRRVVIGLQLGVVLLTFQMLGPPFDCEIEAMEVLVQAMMVEGHAIANRLDRSENE